MDAEGSAELENMEELVESFPSETNMVEHTADHVKGSVKVENEEELVEPFLPETTTADHTADSDNSVSYE